MSSDPTRQVLGDLQLAIMRVLWTQGEATVAQVQEELEDERDPATTTVATVLTRMKRKGLVAHRKDGRQFVYRAAVSEDQLRSHDVGELMERWFGGDQRALLSHLLGADDVTRADLDRIKNVIARGRKRRV